MRNLLQNSLLIIVFLFITSGCATTINASRIVPAGSTDVTNYKTVAFLDFKGNRGADVSSRLESTVIKAEVNGKKQYAVVDRKNINKILQEQQFQMTIANPDTIVDFGQLIGAEAIWYGNAESRYNVTHSYETRSECARYVDGRCRVYREYNVPCERRNIVVNITPKLSSVATGKVIYSKDFQEQSSSYYCSDSYFGARTEAELYNDALNEILYRYRLDIAPYVENVKIELMSKKDGTNKKSEELLKSGIEFAKVERMEKACELWASGLKETPASISLNYNMGVCSELSSNYEKALNYYLKAENNSLKPIKTISDAIERAKENIANQKTLKRQM